jgi:uncharacterized membrane protein
MRRRQAIAVLALAGLFVSLYLWLHKLGLIGVLQCGTGGCDTVQASPYADFLGLPVALYGVAGYAVLFVVSFVAVQQPDAPPRPARWPDVALAILASLGFVFTLYLTVLELFVIHATCRWCLGSAAIITLIALLSLSQVRRGP